MKATVILAMIPLGIATAFLPSWPDPQPAKAEPPLTFQQRFEPVYPVHTFEERWWPGEGLPFDPRWQHPVRVRTIPIRREDVAPPLIAPAVHIVQTVRDEAPAPRVRQAAVIKPRPIRVADICTRHGMHKQITRGGKSWRCRK